MDEHVKLFPSLSRVREDSSSLTKLDEKITGNIFSSIEYEISGILDKINNINTINDAEIDSIISRQYHTILNYDLFLANSETRHMAQKLFTNKRFLQRFLNLVGTLTLTNHEKICLNKIAYDYYIFSEKDPEISDLLYQITTWANNKEVLILSGMLGMNGAKMLAMIRNSSFRDEKCIRRVNIFIIKCGIQLSVQNIIDIFCFLYPRFTPVFVNSMLEPKPPGLLEDQSNRFDAISLALLKILDSMPSSEMAKVLYAYSYAVASKPLNYRYRFSLSNLPNYPRITQVVHYLNVVENMRLP